MARPAADGIRAKIPSYAAPALIRLGGGSTGGRGKRQICIHLGFFFVFGLGFLMSYSIQDCHTTPQAFTNESWLCHTHRSHFTGRKVKWKGKHRWEHLLECSE